MQANEAPAGAAPPALKWRVIDECCPIWASPITSQITTEQRRGVGRKRSGIQRLILKKVL
jgi:hypothetical protein